MVNEPCPAAFAMKVKVTTGSCPETPLAPGGRVAVTCMVPSSSRCVTVTICPSCASKVPLETFTTCSSLESKESCRGTEYTFCAPFSTTFTVKVEPACCVIVGGSKAKLADAPPRGANCGSGSAEAVGGGLTGAG